MVATNVDYTPGKIQDDMKIFSCGEADNGCKKLIESALHTAKKVKLPFRIYPIEMEELIMCEMNPLKIVFLSYDGCVSPCVYLNLSKQGSIPRIFCGNQYEIERQCFGNIEQDRFMVIWERGDYKNFREFFTRRMAVNRMAFDFVDDLQSKNDALAGLEKREVILERIRCHRCAVPAISRIAYEKL